MGKLLTAARVVHDLGLAACFGGTLFGKVVFNPSLVVVSSKAERGKVGGNTWNHFNVFNAASFVLAACAWSPWRRALVVEAKGRRTLGLVRMEDVLLGVAGSTGLAAVIAQVLLYRQAPEGAVPLETGSVPAPGASAQSSLLQHAVGALGSVNATLFGALLATTAVLSRIPVRDRGA